VPPDQVRSHGIAQSQDEDPKPKEWEGAARRPYDQEPSAFPDRCRSMGAKDLGAATVIETDTLLVKCPHCGGWPMAASFSRNPARREIRFRCAQCRHQEGGRLRRAGSGQRLSGNPAHSGAHREMR
jgi:hypothetical protein